MRAVRFDKYGGIDVLRVADVPVPEPAQGQVLVKVKAASINPGEAKIREGWFEWIFPATFPSGEGTDLAGIVTKIGPGVEGFAAGDEASPTSVVTACSTPLSSSETTAIP